MSKNAKISVINILFGDCRKATKQIFKAIKIKKRKAYITKRWRIIAIILKIVPARILIKYF